ncbi:MAG: hypothetical protein K5849_00255, partial [Bacteroidales bacterium]|nr:hypothetical protein [Bacteroidales bacterium]
MKKRCLALILAIMLCIGILPTPALAEGEGATDGEVSPDYTYMYPDGKSAIPDDMDDGEEGTPVEGAANFAPYVVSKEKVSVSVPTANTSLSVRRLTATGPDASKGGEVENDYNTGSVNSNVTQGTSGTGTQEASSKDTQEASSKDTQEASGNGTQEVLGNLTQDVFDNGTQEVSGNGTQEVSGNGTQEVSGNGTQEVSGNGTQEVSGNGTQEDLGNLTQEVLGNSTQEVLTNGTQETSGTDAPVVVDDHTQEAPVNGTSGTNNTSSEAVIDQFDLSTLEVNIEGGNAFTYTGSPIEPAVTALNLPTNLTSEDYSVSYGENTDAGTSAGSIRITAASNRTIGSQTVYFDIEPRNVSDAVVTGIDDPTSSALATEDTVAAAVDNRKLTWGVDAELSVQDNVPGSGNCTVTITGKNNYTGTWSRVYGLFSEAVLQQIDLADVTVTIVDGNSFIYTGSQIRPEVQVSDLTTDDYSVFYGDNIGVGTAAGSITIVPCSNKTTGSQTVYFDIEPRSISGAVVTLSSVSDTYDGADKKPTVEKVVLGDTELGTGDYLVSYAPETAWIGAGEYDVTVGGQGNYTGTVPATFTINPASIADGYIEGLSRVIDVADVTADGFDVLVGTKTLATGEYSFSAQASGTIVT